MPAVLSAGIVMYHCGEEIDHALRCLESADLEIAVYLCDNSPEDITADRIKWHFPGVTILTEAANLGYARAQNLFLPSLQCRYHLVMHPDITFDPSLLRAMVAYMDMHPRTAVLIPRILNEDGSEQFLPKRDLSVRALLGGLLRGCGNPFRHWREVYTMQDRDVQLPLPVECAAGCFLLIRTSVFQQLGGFDTRFFLYQEDCDFCRQVRENNLGSILYHPGFRVTHLHVKGEAHSFRGRMRQLRSAVRYFRKWGISW